MDLFAPEDRSFMYTTLFPILFFSIFSVIAIAICWVIYYYTCGRKRTCGPQCEDEETGKLENTSEEDDDQQTESNLILPGGEPACEPSKEAENKKEPQSEGSDNVEASETEDMRSPETEASDLRSPETEASAEEGSDEGSDKETDEGSEMSAEDLDSTAGSVEEGLQPKLKIIPLDWNISSDEELESEQSFLSSSSTSELDFDTKLRKALDDNNIKVFAQVAEMMTQRGISEEKLLYEELDATEEVETKDEENSPETTPLDMTNKNGQSLSVNSAEESEIEPVDLRTQPIDMRKNTPVRMSVIRPVELSDSSYSPASTNLEDLNLEDTNTTTEISSIVLFSDSSKNSKESDLRKRSDSTIINIEDTKTEETQIASIITSSSTTEHGKSSESKTEEKDTSKGNKSQKPLECTICGKKIQRQCGLKSHMETKHSKQIPNEDKNLITVALPRSLQQSKQIQITVSNSNSTNRTNSMPKKSGNSYGTAEARKSFRKPASTNNYKPPQPIFKPILTSTGRFEESNFDRTRSRSRSVRYNNYNQSQFNRSENLYRSVRHPKENKRYPGQAQRSYITYSCNFCPTKFTDNYALNLHMNQYHRY